MAYRGRVHRSRRAVRWIRQRGPRVWRRHPRIDKRVRPSPAPDKGVTAPSTIEDGSATHDLVSAIVDSVTATRGFVSAKVESGIAASESGSATSQAGSAMSVVSSATSEFGGTNVEFVTAASESRSTRSEAGSTTCQCGAASCGRGSATCCYCGTAGQSTADQFGALARSPRRSHNPAPLLKALTTAPA
jgi:hypothetical protein